ncbi:MAG TPA: DUF2207 domain-containing protein, partial [Thermomicrobiales bacterium]|nr:DUF2207 domain-containing protein [Thermomicrobiales bacterium]
MSRSLCRVRPRVVAGCLLLISFVLLGAPPGGGAAQSDRSAGWDRYDVTIEVRDDGSFRITERMVVAFSGGPFTFGYADIPLGRVEAIENVAVAEETEAGQTPFRQVATADSSKEPGTYIAEQRGDSFHVEYYFDPTTDQTRTFVLAYDAVGALRVYREESPPNEQVWWIAIGKEVTDVGRIEAASVTIVLPQAVDPAQVVLGEDTEGPAGEHTSDGQTWRWERSNLGQDDDFVTRMQFPPITHASAPSWQAADDEQRAEAERERDRR